MLERAQPIYTGDLFYFLYGPILPPPVPSLPEATEEWRETRYNVSIVLNEIPPSVIPHFRKYKQSRPRQEDDLYQEVALSYKRYGHQVHSALHLEEGEALDIELEETGAGEHQVLYAHYCTAITRLEAGHHHHRLQLAVRHREG